MGLFTVAHHVHDKLKIRIVLKDFSFSCVLFDYINSGGISLSRIGCPFSGYVATTVARVALFLMLAPSFAEQKRFVVVFFA